jgi:hypothetical protein
MAVMGLVGFHSPARAGTTHASRATSKRSVAVQRRLFIVLPSLRSSENL